MSAVHWIAQLTVDEARSEMRRLWREREAAIAESDYDEVERLNLIQTVDRSRNHSSVGERGGDV